jgi:single-stranded DNA-binding protein
MMSIQIVSVIGNATKDAETKISKDGVSYVTFRLAVGDRNGISTFYNVVVFGHYGEVLQEHITRGRKVFVNGKIQISEKGYVSVVADHIELLAQPKSKTAVANSKKVKDKTQKALASK